MEERKNRDLSGSSGRSKFSIYQPIYNKSVAIVIGIDTYKDPKLRPLGKAEADARSISDILSGKPYNFQVELLLGVQATQMAIKHALKNVIDISQADDRVIFYFAGHGYIHPDNRGFDAGYLACSDTNPDDPFDGLEYDEVKKLTRYAKAKHIAFILDTCFSGTALGLTRSAVQLAAVQEYLLYNAYQVLTAGGVEVVSDARSMTGELVKALREGFPGEERPITFNRMGQHIQDVIHSQSHGCQTPIYGFLEGSSKGQMVLLTPGRLDFLPKKLGQDLTDANPKIRWYALGEVAQFLVHPDLNEKVRLLLEEMQIKDENLDVRLRASEVIQRLTTTPVSEIGLDDEESIDKSEEQNELEQQPSQLPEQLLLNDQPSLYKKLNWRWIIGIIVTTVVVFVIAWVSWMIWGSQFSGRTETNNTPNSIPPACTKIRQTWTSPIDGMTLVCVPAGGFVMGSDVGSDNEKPEHTVYLNAFWIDQTEVTNGMYAKFIAQTSYPNAGSSSRGQSDYPVTNVDWNDATAYCQWAQRQLPSEAQWEKAARGTDERTYPWGNEDPDCTLANSINVSTSRPCENSATPVGSYPHGASPYNALDMAGNVWEWVNDWYQWDCYRSSSKSNPTGPTSGTYRVLRGCSWYCNIDILRMSNRNYDYQHGGFQAFSVGFRCRALQGELSSE